MHDVMHGRPIWVRWLIEPIIPSQWTKITGVGTACKLTSATFLVELELSGTA